MTEYPPAFAELVDAEKEVQKLTDQYVAEIDKGLTQKEAELLKV